MDTELSLMQTLISDNSQSIKNDLWDKITDYLEKDGIDYFNDPDSFRIITSTQGSSVLVYKGNPYCVWSEPKIEMGFSDELTRSIRATIILKKL